MTPIEVIHAYFDGCNTGELEQLMATLAPDVVHYFLPEAFPPIKGAEALARYWRKYWLTMDPRWRVDHAIVSGDEAVSEWSCDFCPRGGTQRQMVRGTEWYVFRGGKIAEIRAYFATGGLAGFPYAARGYLK
jgi:ketosteroid isomerase-like protein